MFSGRRFTAGSSGAPSSQPPQRGGELNHERGVDVFYHPYNPRVSSLKRTSTRETDQDIGRPDRAPPAVQKAIHIERH